MADFGNSSIFLVAMPLLKPFEITIENIPDYFPYARFRNSTNIA